MKLRKIPQIYRNVQDSSITITYGTPFCSLIWLHGLCDTSEGFFSYFTHSHSPVYEGVRVKIIQAPLKNITINKGQVCHGWYDILSTDRFTGDEAKTFNFTDIKQSFGIIDSHVKEQVREWGTYATKSKINPYHRVYIGGFSQGGVMSVGYSLQSQVPPAGAISLSGYSLKSFDYRNIKKVPMLLMNGDRDPIIREKMARVSYEQLVKQQYLVEYHKVEGLQHTVSLNQLSMMKRWIKNSFRIIEKYQEGNEKGKDI